MALLAPVATPEAVPSVKAVPSLAAVPLGAAMAVGAAMWCHWEQSCLLCFFLTVDAAGVFLPGQMVANKEHQGFFMASSNQQM